MNHDILFLLSDRHGNKDIVHICQRVMFLPIQWKHKIDAGRHDIQDGGWISSWALIQARLVTNDVQYLLIFANITLLYMFCIFGTVPTYGTAYVPVANNDAVATAQQ